MDVDGMEGRVWHKEHFNEVSSEVFVCLLKANRTGSPRGFHKSSEVTSNILIVDGDKEIIFFDGLLWRDGFVQYLIYKLIFLKLWMDAAEWSSDLTRQTEWGFELAW